MVFPEGVFLTGIGLLGLMVGSFLNVVIHRLPIMLDHMWRRDAYECVGIEHHEVTSEPYNLVIPRSRCPHCAKLIYAYENIPILSYIMLRGRCSGCGTPISLRYPLVELLTAVLSLIVAWHFGFTWQTLSALVFTWSMIALSFIDCDKYLLPDVITLPLLWIGLLLSIFDVFIDSRSSILGAALGYLALWIIYHLFKYITGKEGMGFGDFKLLAAIGAWCGLSQLPVVILLSSVTGAVVGIGLIHFAQRDSNTPIPFGPYLAASAWVTLLTGNALNTAYLEWVGLLG